MSGPPSHRPRSDRGVLVWLLVVAALVFSMVLLGGVTRLTESGLSIVDWQPLMGILPPLGEAEWQAVFERYQQFPEFQKRNFLMTLADFKTIYWFEYAHRLLGRAIGIVFFVPFVFFLVTKRLEGGMAKSLAGLFVLGGLQGALGWYMVKSGLVDDPRVSPYRLTAHLGLAVLIYGMILWLALGRMLPRAGRPAGDPAAPGVRVLAWVVGVWIFVTVLSGGFVAGNDAGFVYNTFPLMEGRLVPADYALIEPFWRNLFENIAAVQFNHRVLAVGAVVAVAALWLYGVAKGIKGMAQGALHVLFGAALVQLGLGIATLLLVVPVALGALHQAGALVLFTAALVLNYVLRPGPSPSAR